VTYDPANDATGIPGSGSAKLTFTLPSGAGSVGGFNQCIVTGPGQYTLGAKVLIPNGQPPVAGTVFAVYFSTNNCTTGFLGQSFLKTSTTGSFQTLSGLATAPAGTASVQIIAGFQATPGTYTVNYDDFVFDNSPLSVTAPALGRIGLILLIAAFAAMGLLFSTKRRSKPI